jgi:hypothetical protein
VSTILFQFTMRHHRNRRAVLVVALLPTLLAACVPVPWVRQSGPNREARANLQTQAPKLVPGETSRTRLLMTLGEPDGRAVDDSWFVYASLDKRPGFHLAYIAFVPGGEGVLAGRVGSWDTSRRLIVRFNDEGTVSSVSLDETACNADNTGLNVSFASCLDASGSDLAAARKGAEQESDHQERLAALGRTLRGSGEHVQSTFNHVIWYGEGSSPWSRGAAVGNRHHDGDLVVTETGIVFTTTKAGDEDVRTAYTDVRRVKIEGYLTNMRVRIELKSGREESFAIREERDGDTAPSAGLGIGLVDHDATQRVGELLQAKIPESPH